MINPRKKDNEILVGITEKKEIVFNTKWKDNMQSYDRIIRYFFISYDYIYNSKNV